MSPGRKITVAWCITGAGHFLPESFDVFKKLKKHITDLRVTTFVSLAAEEVIRMYGLEKAISSISGGDYLEEVFYESQQGASYPKTGRFLLDKYDVLVVSPATSNTIAKLAYGIADTLVTNAVAQAVKGSVPVYIVPVDIAGEIVSKMPFSIDREICTKCESCPPADNCPEKAINDQIDLLRCTGCGICIKLCSYGAIRGGRAKLRVRDVDFRNVNILRQLEGVTVLERPEDIPSQSMKKLKY